MRGGIANLLFIPILEDDGYIFSTDTKGDLVVTTLKDNKIIFKRDTGVCKVVPYIDLWEHKEGISMIEAVHKKFVGATKQDIDKAVQSRTVQSIGHPPFSAVTS